MGDIVEIPEADHRVNESWQGLSEEAKTALENCLMRKVEIIVNGFTNTVIISPGFLKTQTVSDMAKAKWSGLSNPSFLSSFWLHDVVD